MELPERSKAATNISCILTQVKAPRPRPSTACLLQWSERSSRWRRTSCRRVGRSRRQRRPCCTRREGASKYPKYQTCNKHLKGQFVLTWVAQDEKWVFKSPWSPPSNEPVLVASSTWSRYRYMCKMGWGEKIIKNAHQIVVSGEVGFEDKDTGIEAVWPTSICWKCFRSYVGETKKPDTWRSRKLVSFKEFVAVFENKGVCV